MSLAWATRIVVAGFGRADSGLGPAGLGFGRADSGLGRADSGLGRAESRGGVVTSLGPSFVSAKEDSRSNRKPTGTSISGGVTSLSRTRTHKAWIRAGRRTERLMSHTTIASTEAVIAFKIPISTREYMGGYSSSCVPSWA